jgi:hypothetical protein
MSPTHPPPPEGTDRDAPWTAAQRAEEWAGELRINLIRMVAIAAFYGQHLINYYFRKLADLTPEYHLVVTGIALSWTAAALALHIGLARRRGLPYLKYAAVAWDSFMATSLLVVSDGPRSPLLVILFLIVATAALRVHLRLVWVASLLVILSYGVVCGHSRWVRPETRVPVHHHVIFVLALGSAGLLAGQCVRQTRRFARDYAERLESVRRIAGGTSPDAKGDAS